MIDILNYTFFQNALWAILLISTTSAIIGTYIVARRMLFITGGITHASFGGLGVGYYLGINPTLSALVFAILSALGVEWLSRGKSVREDSAIAVVWALGMAIGIIFIFMTPGYTPGLPEFLRKHSHHHPHGYIHLCGLCLIIDFLHRVAIQDHRIYGFRCRLCPHPRYQDTPRQLYHDIFCGDRRGSYHSSGRYHAPHLHTLFTANDRRTFLSQIPKYRLAVGSNQSPLRHRRTITLLLARRPCGGNHRIYLDNRLFCCKNYSFLPTFCNR